MSSSLKEYLKKYQSSDDVDKKKKKKKKQKKPDVTGVLVVDEDPVWQKPVVVEEDNDNDSEDEQKPQVEEDIDVKRIKRLEAIKARRPFGLISDDGSGWVPVSHAPQNLIDSSSDISPPRKRRSRNDTPSPVPEPRPSGTEIADLSPPRQRQRRHRSPSNSEDEKVDMSPPRRRRTRLDTPSPEQKRITSEPGHEDLDLSPPRRRSQVPDPALSPPRRVRRDSSSRIDSHSSLGEDLSPVRKSRAGDTQSQVSDLSPPRKSRRDLSPPRKQLKESTSLADQQKTGLVSGKDVAEEVLKAKNQEFLRFKAKDPSITGKGAEPIYRDKKTGQRITKEEFLKSQKKEEKPKEVKLEWGKGLAQKREAEAKQEELELEKAKPFARTRDDPDLDRMMKDRLRWGDPMAHLVKKKHAELILPDMGDDENMKASGFIVPQDIPKHSWIIRRLEAAPNRYGIKPGRHWDGVDRSTGFEKAMFTRMNENKATEREAYLWSVSDM